MGDYDVTVLGRISSIVAAESTSDGALMLSFRAVDGVSGFRMEPATLTFALWRVNADIIRLSLTNPKTGTVAYFQGATPAVALAEELGVELLR